MDWTKEEKQMGETVIEKIIRNNVGHAVKPGDIVTVNVDRVMIHDIFIPRTFELEILTVFSQFFRTEDKNTLISIFIIFNNC